MSVKASPIHRQMTLTTHDICNHSSAQHKFSFGTGARFKSCEKKRQVTDFTVTLPSTLSSRRVSMGHGPRFISHKRSTSPDPGAYDQKSTMD